MDWLHEDLNKVWIEINMKSDVFLYSILSDLHRAKGYLN
jgi:hypothetical protein